MSVVTLTDSNFNAEVIDSAAPVAVDFWAQWCGPCRMLGPIMEEVAADLDGQVKVGKLNVDENPAISKKYGIQSIPAIMVFKNGQVVDQFVGVRPKLELVDRLKKQV